MTTALDTILETGIKIAVDGADFANIPYSDYKAVDATTNPSLVLEALSKPEYLYILDEAVAYANKKLPGGELKERTEFAMDYLLVKTGAQILKHIPGRVSVSLDPRLAEDYDGIVKKSQKLIQIFEELNVSRDRVLIKIPATYTGIRAAQALESPSTSTSPSIDSTSLPIHTNLTLIFGLVQAVTCAQAGVSVISPFIGRVQDWWSGHEFKRTGIENPFTKQPLHDHHGILLIRQIRSSFDQFGYTAKAKTEIMAAGFRRPEEVLELATEGKHGGADLFSVPPSILEALKGTENVNGNLEMEKVTKVLEHSHHPEPSYISAIHDDKHAEARFNEDAALEQVILDKLPEGLKKFSEDSVILEEKIKAQLMLPSPNMPGGWGDSKSVEAKIE